MDRKIVALFLLIIVVGATYGGYKWYKGQHSEENIEVVVDYGDTVYINYTGWLNDTRIYDAPRVFDTSYAFVAENDTKYPKTLTFSRYKRSGAFSFEAGKGSVIEGWDKNVMGMKVGDEATWYIPPDEGYMPRLPELVRNISSTEETEMFETIKTWEFSKYYHTDAVKNMVVKHYFWGWNAEVVDVLGNDITLYNLPEKGDRYLTKYGWNCTVIYVNQSDEGGRGIIQVRHEPNLGTLVNVDDIEEHNASFSDIKSLQRQYQGSTEKGIVVSVGENITIDFNNEVYGRTLRFDVKIERIDKS